VPKIIMHIYSMSEEIKNPTHYKVSLSDHVIPFILTLSQTVLASLYHIDNVASNGINVL
jgi:hypothetical protein